MEPTTGDFQFDGHRLVYDEYGSGRRLVVLLPGLLFSRKMHRPLAQTLAERGHRVVCLDLLGHGDSDRPPEMGNYSMIDLRPPGDRAARPPRGRQGGRGRHVARRQRRARGRRRGARARPRPAGRDARARQRAAGLRDRVHPAAREPHLRGADRPPARRRGATGAAHRVAPARHDARLGQPGPEAVGVGAPGAVLRPRRAALRGAPRADPADAGDRPLPRPRPPLLGLGHAGARAAQRPARGGVLDPRAAAHAGAADRRDRRSSSSAASSPPRRAVRRAAGRPRAARRDSHKAS